MKVSEVEKELKDFGCNEEKVTKLLVKCGILKEDKKEIGIIHADDVFELVWSSNPDTTYHVYIISNKKGKLDCLLRDIDYDGFIREKWTKKNFEEETLKFKKIS